jgi:hypothetical protein
MTLANVLSLSKLPHSVAVMLLLLLLIAHETPAGVLPPVSWGV